jgi:hypothetical protein
MLVPRVRVGPVVGRTWWAHLAFTRISIELTILRKEFEDVREAGATLVPKWSARRISSAKPTEGLRAGVVNDEHRRVKVRKERDTQPRFRASPGAMSSSSLPGSTARRATCSKYTA